MSRIISVGGCHKGVGKTTVAAFLLKRFPGYAALKVTQCTGQCPRPEPCGVCERLSEPYAIIEDETIINTKDTDTAYLAASGAAKTIWLQATQAGLKDGIKAALEILRDYPGIITEGNSFISAWQPAVSLLVLSTSAEDFKPSATTIQNQVDAFVFNKRAEEPPQQFLTTQKNLREILGNHPVFLVEPKTKESLDNEMFLDYLKG